MRAAKQVPCRWGKAVRVGLVIAAAAWLSAACATLPPAGPDAEITAQRKAAADYARQGDANLTLRNWSLAETFYLKSLETNQAVDNVEGVVQSHFSLGFLYLNRAMPDQASLEFRIAAELAQQLGSQWFSVQAKLNLAKLELWRKNSTGALEIVDQALAEANGSPGAPKPAGIGVEFPNPPDDRAKSVQMAAILHSRSVALKDLKRNAEARADLTKALQINTDIKANKERAGNLYALASLDNAEDKFADALAHLQQALALDKQAEASDAIVADLYALSQVLRKLNDESGKPRLAEAYDCLRRSYQAAVAINDAFAAERNLGQLIELAAKLGRKNDQALYTANLANLRAKLKENN